MRPPRRPVGTRALLFDRLTDENRQERTERRPLRRLDPDQALASIGVELERLVNTRRSPVPDKPPVAGTTLGFGVPDHVLDNPASVRDRDSLARDIMRAIRFYEPRLANPRVEVMDHDLEAQTVTLAVAGTVETDTGPVPVSFPILLGGSPVDGHSES